MAHFLTKPGFLLARVDQISTAIFTSSGGTGTLNQAEFLLLLNRIGPMIQIDLARSGGVDKSTTAYILDNLQEQGWIVRTARENDKRSSLVSLTPSGQALIPHFSEKFAALQQQLMAPVDPADRPFLLDCLYKVGTGGDISAPLWQPACDRHTGLLDTAPSFLCRRVLQLLHAQFLLSTKGSQLTLRQFSLLVLLDQRQSITRTEFARIFGVDPATCAVILKGPTQRGLIAGTPSKADKRARLYRITEAGRDVLRQVHPLVDESEDIVFRSEPRENRVRLIDLLRRIVGRYSPLLRFPGAISDI